MKFIYVILSLLFISSCSLFWSGEEINDSNIAIVATPDIKEKEIYQEENLFIEMDKDFVGEMTSPTGTIKLGSQENGMKPYHLLFGARFF